MQKRFILVFFLLTPLNQSDLPEETILATSSDSNSSSLSFLLSLYVDTTSSKKTPVPLSIDFNSSSLLMGDSNKLNWGINCSDISDCQITDPALRKDSYNGNNYKYQTAKVPIRFSSQLDSPPRDIKMDFRYIEERDSGFDSNGVVGLSPDSDYFKYVRHVYGPTDMAVYLRKKDKGNKGEEWELDLILRHCQDEMMGEHKLLNKSQWSFQAQVNDLSSGVACLDPMANMALGFKGAANICDQSLSKVCGEEKSCNYKGADLNKADSITVNISNTIYTIKGEDYMFNNNGKVGCGLVESNSNSFCDFTLGRLFAARYPPVLLIDSEMKVLFLERFKYKQNMGMITAVIIGCVVMLGLVIAALELLLFRMKRSEKEEETDSLTEKL